MTDVDPPPIQPTPMPDSQGTHTYANGLRAALLATLKIEMVLTRRGDRLVGHVIGLTKAGLLRFASSQFDGEVRVKASELVSINLVASQPSTAPDTVVITNGDRLAGRVTAITADSVGLDSDAAGPVSISRKVVQMIAFGRPACNRLESNFANGRMEPWKVVKGGWKVEGGSLVCSNPERWDSVKASINQEGPLAIEITMDAAGAGGASVFATLFADEPNNPNNWLGNNGVWFRLEDNLFYMGYCQGGGANQQIALGVKNAMRGGANVIRVAYDPEAGKSRCWINGEHGADCDVTGMAPKTGTHIIVGTLSGCKIKSIRVTGGESASALGADDKSDTDLVRFTNTDHVTAESLTLADGQLHVQTAHGDLACPVARVGGIVLASGNRETPKLLKNQAQIQTPAGNLTLQVDTLDEQSLAGKSDYLGEVTIRRGAIKGIQFNANPPIDSAADSNEYEIQLGDSLAKIAQERLGNASDWKRILELNPGLDAANLRVGKKIKLPPRPGGEPAPTGGWEKRVRPNDDFFVP